ncbi:MAG: hypothetical protein JXB49_12480 [Bacteroidales bacterium]|nr:hypothetical protein [Bacteroidales bacterium]
MRLTFQYILILLFIISKFSVNAQTSYELNDFIGLFKEDSIITSEQFKLKDSEMIADSFLLKYLKINPESNTSYWACRMEKKYDFNLLEVYISHLAKPPSSETFLYTIDNEGNYLGSISAGYNSPGDAISNYTGYFERHGNTFKVVNTESKIKDLFLTDTSDALSFNHSSTIIYHLNEKGKFEREINNQK